MSTAAVAASIQASSYRVKFDREHFIELVRIARPNLLFRIKNMYFFAYDGFVMYCDQCQAGDFSEQILDAIEFSNTQWAK
jgi:hypothetical protein